MIPLLLHHPVPWSRGCHTPTKGAIIHAMGEIIAVPGKGEFLAAEFLERSPELTGLKYSAHRLIDPTGDIVICVEDNREAFHAGESRYGDLIYLNHHYLGAEWLVPGVWEYSAFKKALQDGSARFTDAQYESGGWQYAQWIRAYGFGRPQIVTHQEVAGDDVRGPGKGKLDPGVAFNHGRLTLSIERWLNETNN